MPALAAASPEFQRLKAQSGGSEPSSLRKGAVHSCSSIQPGGAPPVSEPALHAFPGRAASCRTALQSLQEGEEWKEKGGREERGGRNPPPGFSAAHALPKNFGQSLNAMPIIRACTKSNCFPNAHSSVASSTMKEQLLGTLLGWIGERSVPVTCASG